MKIKIEDLKQISKQIFKKYGMSESDAKIVSDIYVSADRFGISTHGVKIIPAHIDKIIAGGYNLNPNFKVVRSNVSFCVIDGDNSFGPLCAKHCMDIAITEAKKKGIYTVFSFNNNTYGAAYYYSMMAVQNGLIGVTFCNSPAAMAPIGGYEKLLGTNPISIAIPACNHNPILLDMATSKIAKSKIKVYADNKEKLPLDLALDKEGNPTDDPNEAIQGTLLPMSNYKGYGLAVIIDILSGLISGASFLNSVGSFYNSKDKSMNVGFTFIAIDPKQIYGNDFYKVVDEYCTTIEKSAVIKGNDIKICGYNLFKNANIVDKQGLEIEDNLMKELEEMKK